MVAERFDKVKKEFLGLLLAKNALKVASSPDNFFKLKSGRSSPYFINFGLLNDGESLSMLKKTYSAGAIEAISKGIFEEFSYVFGPAYKGINLAALACEGLHENYKKESFCLYDRKEEKAYGAEAGGSSAEKVIVGAGSFTPGGAMIIVDDVITTGKAKYDALEKIALLPQSKIAGLLLGVDRQERMGDAEKVEEKSAVQAFQAETGVKTFSILSMKEIYDAVSPSLTPPVRAAWACYARKYGVVQLQ